MVRELARVLLGGDTDEFIRAWNARGGYQIESVIAVAYVDTPLYGELRGAFEEYAAGRDAKWVERRDLEYSEEELREFDLLRVRFVGKAGPGGNTFATVYAEEVSCPSCGAGPRRQIRHLVLDFARQEVDAEEIGYFQHDVCATEHGEWVVSQRAATVLESARVPGIELRPVVPALTGALRPGVEAYFQLLVDEEIGPLVPPTALTRSDPCPACGQFRAVLLGGWPPKKGSEFFFQREGYRGAWAMRTTEMVGRIPRQLSELIIGQPLFRLLKGCSATGFWVQPAHLVDG